MKTIRQIMEYCIGEIAKHEATINEIDQYGAQMPEDFGEAVGANLAMYQLLGKLYKSNPQIYYRICQTNDFQLGNSKY